MSLVVILGTDGAGKTSVALSVTERLRAKGVPANARWARWKPFLLRPLRWVVTRFWLRERTFSRGREEPAEVSEIKRSVVGSGSLAGRVYLLLALLDYWWQHVPYILLRRGAGVLLLDRYWYDLVIDASGNAEGAERTAARLATGGWRFLFPRPARTIFLDVDPEVAYARKGGENTRDYLQRRVAVYRAVAGALGAARIDADQPLDMVVQDTLARVESPAR